jgi:hypothetical protein
MITRDIRQWVLGGCAVLALSLSASAAMASPNGCQNKLQGIGLKYQATFQKALIKCANAVRKTADKDGIAAVGADEGLTCDKAFVKAEAALAKGAEKCRGLEIAGGKCSVADLLALGHLVSGVNAPGTFGGVTDFTCDFILDEAERTAQNAVFAANPSASVEIATAAPFDTTPADGVAKYLATTPKSSTRACTLTASGAHITGGAFDIPLTITGVMAIDVAADAPPSTQVNFTGQPAAGITPIPLLVYDVCVTTARVEGVCDCGSGHWPIDVSLCRDSIASNGDGCTESRILLDDPGTTDNGPMRAEFTGMSTTGACSGVLALSFKVVEAADRGPDGIACTPDDTAPPLPAAGIPFTTGSATATILDVNDMENDLATDTRTGVPATTCADLRRGKLSGMKLVAATQSMDSILGDIVIAIDMQCS